LPESLFKRLNSIKLRLTELQQEDDKSAAEIKTDLFILVKVTGEFDEYLEAINDVSFAHKRLVFNMGHIEKIRTFNAARENLLRIIEQIQKEISAKEEHDATMRAFHRVPLAHELEEMPDIELTELQSQLPSDPPGKTIIENEWRRKSSKKPNPIPYPASKTDEETSKNENRWKWAMFIVTVIGCIFAFPTFYQFINPKPATESTQSQQKTEQDNLENRKPINALHYNSPTPLASQDVASPSPPRPKHKLNYTYGASHHLSEKLASPSQEVQVAENQNQTVTNVVPFSAAAKSPSLSKGINILDQTNLCLHNKGLNKLVDMQQVVEYSSFYLVSGTARPNATDASASQKEDSARRKASAFAKSNLMNYKKVSVNTERTTTLSEEKSEVSERSDGIVNETLLICSSYDEIGQIAQVVLKVPKK